MLAPMSKDCLLPSVSSRSELLQVNDGRDVGRDMGGEANTILTAEKEIGDDTHRPHINRLPVSRYEIQKINQVSRDRQEDLSRSLFLKISGAIY